MGAAWIVLIAIGATPSAESVVTPDRDGSTPTAYRLSRARPEPSSPSILDDLSAQGAGGFGLLSWSPAASTVATHLAVSVDLDFEWRLTEALSIGSGPRFIFASETMSVGFGDQPPSRDQEGPLGDRVVLFGSGVGPRLRVPLGARFTFTTAATGGYAAGWVVDSHLFHGPWASGALGGEVAGPDSYAIGLMLEGGHGFMGPVRPTWGMLLLTCRGSILE